MQETTTIRVIAYKEGDIWVAQCLEHDIGAQADTLEILQRRLQLTIHAEAEESRKRTGSVFSDIPAAPPFFFEKWEHATTTAHALAAEQFSTDMRLCA